MRDLSAPSSTPTVHQALEAVRHRRQALVFLDEDAG